MAGVGRPDVEGASVPWSRTLVALWVGTAIHSEEGASSRPFVGVCPVHEPRPRLILEAAAHGAVGQFVTTSVQIAWRLE